MEVKAKMDKYTPVKCLRNFIHSVLLPVTTNNGKQNEIRQRNQATTASGRSSES